MKKIIFGILLFVFLGSAFTVSAMTDQEKQDLIAQIQSQIVALQEQLNQLIQLVQQKNSTQSATVTTTNTNNNQATTETSTVYDPFGSISTTNTSSTSATTNITVNPSTPTTTVEAWCYNFTKNIGIGDSGKDVESLVIALQKSNINISGTSNNLYDENIASAVTAFQEKYRADILVPNGLTNGNGYVGAKTRAKLNELYGCGETICVSSWNCTDWASCNNGFQSRVCTDLKNCSTPTNKPTERQSCTLSCFPNWHISDWGKCENGTQTRSIRDINNCGTTIGRPQIPESQSCVAPSAACTPNWKCTDYGPCEIKIATGPYTQQARTCTDTNNCGVITGKPTETKFCESRCWRCTNWGACGTIEKALSDGRSQTYSSSQERNCVAAADTECDYKNNKCIVGSTDYCPYFPDYPNAGTIPIAIQKCTASCSPHWECTGWSDCAICPMSSFLPCNANSGITTKKCFDINGCNINLLENFISINDSMGNFSENNYSPYFGSFHMTFKKDPNLVYKFCGNYPAEFHVKKLTRFSIAEVFNGGVVYNNDSVVLERGIPKAVVNSQKYVVSVTCPAGVSFSDKWTGGDAPATDFCNKDIPEVYFSNESIYNENFYLQKGTFNIVSKNAADTTIKILFKAYNKESLAKLYEKSVELVIKPDSTTTSTGTESCAGAVLSKNLKPVSIAGEGDNFAIFDADNGKIYFSSASGSCKMVSLPQTKSNWIPVNMNPFGSYDDRGIGMYDTKTGVFYYKNKQVSGTFDSSFQYKPGYLESLPTAGNWFTDDSSSEQGNKMRVGIFDPVTCEFYLKRVNTQKDTYGVGGNSTQYKVHVENCSRMKPVAGRFYNGLATFITKDPTKDMGVIAKDDNKDAPALYDPITGTFYFMRDYNEGNPIMIRRYLAGKEPIANHGLDGLGVFDPATATFTYRRSISLGDKQDIILRFDATRGVFVRSVVDGVPYSDKPAIIPTAGFSFDSITGSESATEDKPTFSGYANVTLGGENIPGNIKYIKCNYGDSTPSYPVEVSQISRVPGTLDKFKVPILHNYTNELSTYEIKCILYSNQQGSVDNKTLGEKSFTFTVTRSALANTPAKFYVNRYSSTDYGFPLPGGVTYNSRAVLIGIDVGEMAAKYQRFVVSVVCPTGVSFHESNVQNPTEYCNKDLPTTLFESAPVNSEKIIKQKIPKQLAVWYSGSSNSTIKFVLKAYQGSIKLYEQSLDFVVKPLASISEESCVDATLSSNLKPISGMQSPGFYDATNGKMYFSSVFTRRGCDPSKKTCTSTDFENVGYLYDSKMSLFYDAKCTAISLPEAKANWLPLATSYDNIMMYDPVTSTFYGKNVRTSGTFDYSFVFGTPNSGMLPLVGRWDANGGIKIGLYSPSECKFYLKKDNTADAAVTTVYFGIENCSRMKPVAGPYAIHTSTPWKDNTTDTLGLYDPITGTYYFNTVPTTTKQQIAAKEPFYVTSTVGTLDPATATFKYKWSQGVSPYANYYETSFKLNSAKGMFIQSTVNVPAPTAQTSKNNSLAGILQLQISSPLDAIKSLAKY